MPQEMSEDEYTARYGDRCAIALVDLI